jgi:hypothetical protein
MKGNAEVPEKKIFEIIDILYPYRLVESQLGNEALGVSRRHVRVHDSGDGVTGAQPEQYKENGQDDKKDHQYLDESFKDEFSDFHIIENLMIPEAVMVAKGYILTSEKFNESV